MIKWIEWGLVRLGLEHVGDSRIEEILPKVARGEEGLMHYYEIH